MKRCLILLSLFFLIIFLVASISLVSAILVVENLSHAGITGSVSVTGEATDQPVDMRVYVVSFPGVIVYSPKNATYLNQTLLLNYTVYSAYDAWYALDSSGDNYIPNIPFSLYINAGEGSHIIRVYANNSQGQSSEGVQFVVNSTLLTILYRGKFKTSFSGSSTNFYAYSFEELQKLNNIILENVNYGKIQFDDYVNVTDDKDHNQDGIVDIDDNMNISFNRIELNADELPNFNVSSTLWLYGLNFTNPRVLRNGTVCSSDICTKEDYSSGTLRFRVTGFSNYSAEESPEKVQIITVGGGGGGGSGGGTVTPEANYTKPQIIACTNKTEEKVTGTIACANCNSPYIPRGLECCLDENQNGKCDIDEVQEEKPAPTLGTNWVGLIWIGILILFIALVLVITIMYVIPMLRRKSHAPQRRGELTRLSEARNLPVYSINGNKLGNVSEVYLEDNKIYGWLIVLEPNIAKNINKKSALVRHRNVNSMKEVMVIDGKASEYLEKFE
jgi:sporulation protein YlmC with PRC-barrel domain